MADDSVLTIGDLKSAGRRLAMYCSGCVRLRYMNANRYADDVVVSEIGGQLICARCRFKGLETRAVERDLKTGFWPAEYA